MTHGFEVRLPHHLRLLVKVGDHPVDFQIRFPGGRKVDFSFSPKADGTYDSKIVPSAGLPGDTAPREAGWRKKHSRISETTGGPAIEYSEADAVDGSRDMVPFD